MASSPQFGGRGPIFGGNTGGPPPRFSSGPPDPSGGRFRLLLCKVTGTESGKGKYSADIHEPKYEIVLDKTKDATLEDDIIGEKKIENAMFVDPFGSNDLYASDPGHRWYVGYFAGFTPDDDQRPVFLRVEHGGGATLPTGQYVGQTLQVVSGNQTGWDFDLAHGLL